MVLIIIDYLYNTETGTNSISHDFSHHEMSNNCFLIIVRVKCSINLTTGSSGALPALIFFPGIALQEDVSKTGSLLCRN